AATFWYLEYLALGGRIEFQELTRDLLTGPLSAGQPILTGLSATYLYDSAREVDRDGRLLYDDVHGEPTGHFVVLCGYDPGRDEVLVADPLVEKPRYGGHQYVVSSARLLTAMVLGILTYDANLLILEPGPAKEDIP
ncbi:MAG: peptidase-C39 like family protein, partial [Gemmatimonadota bacterium]